MFLMMNCFREWFNFHQRYLDLIFMEKNPEKIAILSILTDIWSFFILKSEYEFATKVFVIICFWGSDFSLGK